MNPIETMCTNSAKIPSSVHLPCLFCIVLFVEVDTAENIPLIFVGHCSELCLITVVKMVQGINLDALGHKSDPDIVHSLVRYQERNDNTSIPYPSYRIAPNSSRGVPSRFYIYPNIRYIR